MLDFIEEKCMNFLCKIWSFIKGILDFINTYFKTIVLLLILFIIFMPSSNTELQNPPNLAKLYLNFPIYESESFAQQIEAIKKNKNIKGVLLIINSPGGVVGASIEIADMIKSLNKQIPVVAYVQSLMASGSYYAGMYASDIYANRGALVGSIGVIFSSVNIEEIMHKIGVKSQGTSAGEFKEIGTITREWTPKEKDFINNLTQEQYKMFYEDVMAARGSRLKSNNPDIFANGKVFSAKQALELGMIDKVGSMEDAILHLQKLSHVKDPIWLKKNKVETYINKFFDNAVSKITTLGMANMWAIWR